MTTFDEANPSISQFMFWKLGKAMTKRERAKESNRTHVGVIATVKLMMHLAGFGSLTFAGFTVSMTVGLIVAGCSFFVLSWLTPANRPQATDPTATRR